VNAPAEATVQKVSSTEDPLNKGSIALNFLFDNDTLQGCAIPIGAPVSVVVKRLRGLADIIERQHKSPKQEN